MSDLLLRRIGLLLLAVLTDGCATATSTIHATIDGFEGHPTRRPAVAARHRLHSRAGGRWHGARRVQGVTEDHFRLGPREVDNGNAIRSIDHANVVFVARIVKMSKGTRGWLGAANWRDGEPAFWHQHVRRHGGACRPRRRAHWPRHRGLTRGDRFRPRHALIRWDGCGTSTGRATFLSLDPCAVILAA